MSDRRIIYIILNENAICGNIRSRKKLSKNSFSMYFSQWGPLGYTTFCLYYLALTYNLRVSFTSHTWNKVISIFHLIMIPSFTWPLFAYNVLLMYLASKIFIAFYSWIIDINCDYLLIPDSYPPQSNNIKIQKTGNPCMSQQLLWRWLISVDKLRIHWLNNVWMSVLAIYCLNCLSW